MLELIRASLGYEIEPDLAVLDEAQREGLVQTMRESEYHNQSSRLGSLAEDLKSATSEEKSANSELVQTDAKRRRRGLEATIEETKSSLGGFVKIEGIYVRPTEKGVNSLPETEIINGYSDNYHRLSGICSICLAVESAMIAVAAALVKPDSFDYEELAQKSRTGWAIESAFVPLAEALRDGKSINEFSQTYKTLSEIVRTGWIIESATVAPTAALVSEEQLGEFQKVYAQLFDICRTGWTVESAALAPTAALLIGKDLGEYKKVYDTLSADVCRTGWAIESAIVAPAAALVKSNEIDSYRYRYSQLSKICRTGWKEESADVAIAAAVVPEDKIPHFKYIYNKLSSDVCRVGWATESATVSIAAGILTSYLDQKIK